MPIKLLALDMDGTTLTSQVTLTAATRDAITAAIARGITVVPTSGRCLHTLPKEVLAIPGIRYAITSGGAAVNDLHTRTTLGTIPLTAEEVARTRALAGIFDVMIEAYIDGRIFLPKACLDNLAYYRILPRYHEFYRQNSVAIDEPEGFEEILENSPVEKLNISFHQAEDRSLLAGLLREKTRLTIIPAAENNLEINSGNANKAEGLKQLAVCLGIDASDIMAIGDSGNDVAMLRWAGCGIAMANAADNVKAVADAITATNDADGVACAIREHILRQAV